MGAVFARGVDFRVSGELMGYLKWSSRYSVHVQEIDEQHKNLIKLINEMYDAMQARKGTELLEAVLTEFVQYTVYHFNTEERLLRKFGYPDYDVHKAMHDALSAKARDAKYSFDRGIKPTNIEVMLLLTNWLNVHILEEDQKYVPYVSARHKPEST